MNTTNQRSYPTNTEANGPIPYGFIPVETQHAIRDQPVAHDGTVADGLSGEILVTLTTLTPLVVGNHQQKTADGKSAEIEPQTLPDDRILLPATSLKGMLRHSLTSLLDTPMQNVTERHYTYRPNLGFDKDARLEPRAAIVLEPPENGRNGKLLLLPSGTGVVFVRGKMLQDKRPGERLNGQFPGKIDGSAPRQRLHPPENKETQYLNHRLFRYSGGIDGKGALARAFSKDGKGSVYRQVLVTDRAYQDGTTLDLPQPVWNHYLKTQKILANDRIGHLAPGHPLLSKITNRDQLIRDIQQNASLSAQQLVYVEYDTVNEVIVSLGHNFQYRWAYTSSICAKDGRLRQDVSPLSEESPDAAGRPQRLSAGRLLFGYAGDQALAPGVDPHQFGTGDWQRLAGRISPNTAIEILEEGRPRFANNGEPITLRVLGQPRPSAVEFYLQQTKLPDELITYGDLPDDAGGDLAGRKYYRHQPDAATKQDCYAGSQKKTEERGTKVHLMTAPGVTFRFAVRFSALRPWELGALIAALEPSRLAQLYDQENKDGYAHKLGYGKPLGLGSVRLRIDALRFRRDDSLDWQECEATAPQLNTWIDALKEKKDSTVSPTLRAWFSAHAWSTGGRTRYPRETDNKDSRTIFNFHTGLRRKHSKIRRKKRRSFEAFNQLATLLGKNNS